MNTMNFIILIITQFYNNELLNLTIIHSNDIHSHYVPYDKKSGAFCPNNRRNEDKCIGGVSRIKTLIKEERSKNKNIFQFV